MTAAPVWFGPAGKPLFGWLHLPDGGRARGGVVLCPPLAQEYLDSHATLRRLATRLESAGIAVLRIDYTGTGDSAGTLDDTDGVEAITASIGHGIALLRQAGCGQTALVGMRMGAAFATNAAARDGRVDALVLWDPCASGRSFLREVRSLRLLGPGGDREGADHLYDPHTVEDLERARVITVGGPPGRRCLVLSRPSRPCDRRMAEALSMPHVEWGIAEGQAELLDVGTLDSQVPEASIDRIVSWLAPIFERTTTPVATPAAGSAIVGRDVLGRDIVEQAWYSSPRGLFGVTSETAGARGPTVVFLNSSIEHHVGPSRLWVDLGRRLAGLGFRTLRVDLSGLGDSPASPGSRGGVAYALEAEDDVAEAMQAISPRDRSDVVLVGHCSGAYAAIRAGISFSPRGVCAINPPLTFKPAEVDSEGIDPRLRSMARTPPWIRLLGRSAHVQPLLRRLPPKARSFLDRRQERAPAKLLQQLGRSGVDLLLLDGHEDGVPLQKRAGKELRMLATAGRFRFEVIDGLDHRILGRRGRETLGDLLVGHLSRHFTRPSDAETTVMG